MSSLQPTFAEEGTIWLGQKLQDPNDAGWFEIVGAVTDTQLAIFERKITNGDATKDSDDYLSSMIWSDFTGGGQIQELNEASDISRFWKARMDTRVVGQIAPPPYIETIRIGDGNSTVRPLGDIGLHTYIAFGSNARGYDLPNEEFFSTVNALGGTPVRKGTEFMGYLFVPLGSDGFCRLSEATPSTGTLTVTSNAALSGSASAIDAQDFCVMGRKMFAIDILGKLYYTTDGATFTILYLKDDPTVPVQVPTNYAIRGLISFWDKLGTEKLHIITSRAVFIYQDAAVDVEASTLKWAPHPHFGFGFEQWRSGEDLWISAGDDIVKFAGGANIVPNSGLRRDAGLDSDQLGYIVDLQGEMSSLFALLQGTTSDNVDETGLMSVDMTDWGDSYQLFDLQAGKSTLQVNSGSGWACFWESESVTTQVTWMVMAGIDAANYALWWGDTEGNAYRMQQWTDFHNPLTGIKTRRGKFQSDAYIETGRFDANMMGFDKIASHCYIHWHYLPTGSEIEIEYLTDKRELTTGWTSLGFADRSSKSNVLLFDVDDNGFSWGERFNWIEFRIWIRNDRDVLPLWGTAAFKALTFHYTKRPQNATSLSLVLQIEDNTFGMGGMDAYLYLKSLVEADSMIKLVYQRRQFRCRIAGVEKMGRSGLDDTGQVKVNLIDLQPASL